MVNKLISIIVWMGSIIICIYCIGFYSLPSTTIEAEQEITLEFPYSTKTLNNPARGFYTQIDSSDAEQLSTLVDQKIRIVLIAFDIREYLNKSIDKSKLDELGEILEIAKINHLKVIFRAAYGFDGEYSDPDDLNTVYQHIEQIAPILNQYKGTILAVQGGFLGPWGEWHSSQYIETEEGEGNRNSIVKKLVEYLDESIEINLRRPRYIRDAIKGGIDPSRLGSHNDGLLADESDYGTYDDEDYSREEELSWIQKNLIHGINGGEMPKRNKYSSFENAKREFQQLQITYLNQGYNKEVLDVWEKEEYEDTTGLQYMKDHLGYRFTVEKIRVVPLQDKEGIDIQVSIGNYGFAPIDRSYKGYLVIDSEGNEEEFILFSQPISSVKSNEIKCFEKKYNIGSSKGNYEKGRIGVYVGETLEDRQNSVQFANEFIYEEGINYFANYTYNEGNIEVVPIEENWSILD